MDYKGGEAAVHTNLCAVVFKTPNGNETTDTIKQAILQLLTRKGIEPIVINIQFVLLQYLAGDSDKPLIDLIDELF